MVSDFKRRKRKRPMFRNKENNEKKVLSVG